MTQPQGAIVGDNPTAQAVYDALASGNSIHIPRPGGAPPIGGANVPTQEEIKTGVPKEGFVRAPNPDPISASPDKKGIFYQILSEVRAVRKDVQELKSYLSGE